MPSFGKISEAALVGVHPDLVRLARFVVRFIDCRIPAESGVRTIARQRENIRLGLSKTLNSLHLPQEDGFGHAIDLEVYPCDWKAIERGMAAVKKVDPGLQTLEAFKFIGFVTGVAAALGIKIRAGHDWDGDNEISDSTFIDLFHFEKPRGK